MACFMGDHRSLYRYAVAVLSLVLTLVKLTWLHLSCHNWLLPRPLSRRQNSHLPFQEILPI